jgi:D-serine deaminase-like pyridoxal phosphate-dependent protein
MNWNCVPDDHPTPSLIVAEDIVRDNLRSMQEYCNNNNLKLRPHTKTHKSIRMAKAQIDAGASGLTVAKVGEAQVMSQASSDIMIAYPAVGTCRLQRLVALARNHRLRVGIDSQLAAEMLQDAARQANVRIEILADVDVGFHRTGIVDANKAVELCEFVERQSHLSVVGLMCFPGHILPNAQEQLWAEYAECLQRVVHGCNQKGIQIATISGGSTPTARQSHLNPLLTEIRPGTYIYNDLNEVRLGVCTLDQCAARILATIVSTPAADKFIVDAGSKTLSSDRNAANQDAGFGYVVEYPHAKITRLSEEHGEITLPANQSTETPPPRVGDRVWIIPNHICVCVNLQNSFYRMDGDSVEESTVDARGMLI